MKRYIKDDEITHVRIKLSTLRTLRYRFKPYKGETAARYFHRLADWILANKKEREFDDN